jgi:hypothetical protein
MWAKDAQPNLNHHRKWTIFSNATHFKLLHNILRTVIVYTFLLLLHTIIMTTIIIIVIITHKCN